MKLNCNYTYLIDLAPSGIWLLIYFRLATSPQIPLYGITSDVVNLESSNGISFINCAKIADAKYDIDLDNVMIDYVSEISPRKRPIIETCRGMYEYLKHLFPSDVMKNLYPSHLSRHRSSLMCYADGSKTRDGVRYAVTGVNTSITGKIYSHDPLVQSVLREINVSEKKCL